MSVASEIVTSLGTYLKAQAWNALLVTCLYTVGFAVAGVPWWLLFGIVSGALNLIPHLGPVLALAIPLFVQWIGSDGWTPLFWVFGAWIIIQIVDGFVLSPRAAGRAGVNPFLAIAITLGAGVAFGPLGMLLAVPVTIVALLVVRAVRRARIQ